MSVLRVRKPLAPSSSTTSLSMTTDEWSVAYPGLWEMLTAPVGPDGEARDGASLMVFASEDILKCCLTDKDLEQQVWVSAATVPALFCCLETGLQAGTLDWRDVPLQFRKKNKARKK
jgi:hypothetical protein